MRRNEEGLKVAKLRPQILIKGIFWYKIYIRVPLSGGFWSGRGLVSNYRLKSTCGVGWTIQTSWAIASSSNHEVALSS